MSDSLWSREINFIYVFFSLDNFSCLLKLVTGSWNESFICILKHSKPGIVSHLFDSCVTNVESDLVCFLKLMNITSFFMSYSRHVDGQF